MIQFEIKLVQKCIPKSSTHLQEKETASKQIFIHRNADTKKNKQARAINELEKTCKRTHVY